MKLTRTRRVLAVLMGIALLVAVVFQILNDERANELKKTINIQTTSK